VQKTKKVLKILFFLLLVFLILVLIIWFVLRDFRHQWARYFLSQAQAAPKKEKTILLSKALALTPISYAPYLELGKIALTNKKYDQAENLFIWSTRLNKNSIETYLWLTKAQIKQKKPEIAQKTLNKAKLIEPTHPEITFLEANLAIDSQKWDIAEEKLASIKDKQENYEVVYTLLMLFVEKIDKIGVVRFKKSQEIIQTYSQSKNPVFKKAFLAYWWIKSNQEETGCRLVKELKDKNKNVWEKLKTYQQTFSVCI